MKQFIVFSSQCVTSILSVILSELDRDMTVLTTQSTHLIADYYISIKIRILLGNYTGTFLGKSPYALVKKYLGNSKKVCM